MLASPSCTADLLPTASVSLLTYSLLTYHLSLFTYLTALPEGVTGHFYRAECGDGAAHDGYRVVAGACLPRHSPALQRPSPAFVH